MNDFKLFVQYDVNDLAMVRFEHVILLLKKLSRYTLVVQFAGGSAVGRRQTVLPTASTWAYYVYEEHTGSMEMYC